MRIVEVKQLKNLKSLKSTPRVKKTASRSKTINRIEIKYKRILKTFLASS